MNFKTSHLAVVSALVLSLGLGACSKKNTRTEGDVAAADTTTTPVQATDLAAGRPIAELPPVYFEYDSFNLTSSSKGALDRHAEWLKSNAVSVQVEGHCDERGTTEYNLALGERRAATVRDYLVGKGVPAGRLSTISYGEERPAVMGSDESAWSKNRRSEFVSVGQ